METAHRAPLPHHLRAFLYACIDSVEQLEILMLLRITGEAWTMRRVAQALGITDSQARAFLEALTARGLTHATVRGGEVIYSFRPASQALASYCSELALELETSRSDVLRFVASLPSPSIRAFSNAFRLRDSD